MEVPSLELMKEQLVDIEKTNGELLDRIRRLEEKFFYLENNTSPSVGNIETSEIRIPGEIIRPPIDDADWKPKVAVSMAKPTEQPASLEEDLMKRVYGQNRIKPEEAA